ncbi:MAG: hypothetical protein COV66_12760 [Nitrospinae bacterium CG11_big_fil_rev_8_21_14_0_20_45_15]|nr:MAG: hypothetical protein COV66_12760 [Nitrospinae bacterium CG11_big_fil_rev_8_21_14_0_20_45_15]
MSENSRKIGFFKVLFIFIFLWGSSVALAPAKAKAESAESLYTKAKHSFYQLKGSPDKMARRDQWINTVDDFLKVYHSNPKSYPAYKAIFTIGKLYEGLYQISKNPKDSDLALGYYGKLLQEFESDRLKDDALFRRGEIYFDRGHYTLAEKEFEKIVREYSRGDRSSEARQRLKQIVALSPNPSQIEVAQTPLQATAPVAPPAVEKKVAKKEEVKTKADSELLLAQLEQLSPVAGVGIEAKPSAPVSSTPVEKVEPAEKKVAEKKVPLVILDPGHGGKDLGAKGKHGVVEKELNLNLAKKVKAILEKEYKIRVHLTRSDDTFIPLKERGPIANGMKADLFVSLHANAANREAAHGIETYYLGRGLSEQAKETAARENGDLVYSIPDDQTQQILADLISNNKMNDSSRLAGRVQRYLYQKAKKRFKKVKNLGVKEGPFWVLHDTNMPSILVEVGFVTNAKEEARLKDEKYLDLLSEAVAKGIRDFLHENGPMI